ncbi:hypothetical protein [Humibacillus xanthopallidus]|uniref:hypothetical protein n=1 Tax=Humibacillus xanthopallidus TaxID=412689 RepID=UPI001153D8BD|nr:hypothetical protein [Humibacillus xanthopallidus]
MALIALGVTLGIFTTLSMWGGTSADLVFFFFAVAAGCIVGGAVQLSSIRAIAWCLAAAAAFFGLWSSAVSAPDDGTQGIALLTVGFAFLGIACFVVAVTLSVRLWLRATWRDPWHGHAGPST